MVDAVGITTGAGRLKDSAQGDYPNAQSIAIGAAAALTTPFPSLATVVTLRATVACWFSVGGTAAAHVAGSDYLPANTTWMLKIPQGAVLSFIQDSVAGWVSVTPAVNAGPSALLLDTVPLVVAAYSLRKLTNAYNGPCINVRRSIDNATGNIGFTGSGDLDLAGLNTFVGGGQAFVTMWFDQSGNGNNAVRFVTTDQPQLITSLPALNGRPAILFGDGSTKMLAAVDAPSIQNIFANGGFQSSVLTVVATPPTTSNDRVFTKGSTQFRGGNGPTNQPAFIIAASTTTGVWVSTTAMAAGGHVVDLAYSSAVLSNVPAIAVDGTAQTFSAPTQPVGTITSDAGSSLVVASAGAFSGLNGHMAEFLMYKSQPTPGPIRANQKAYWGTP